MKITLAVGSLILMAAAMGLAKDPPSYDKAVLISMESSKCGTTEKGSKTVAGELLGTDGEHNATQEVLCQEYVLQSDRIVYHIRPTDTKHPVLLPVGEKVQFRIKKDKMFVLNSESNSKEREYSVISMQVRQDVQDSRVAKSTE
jgi:hypothetical protein